MVIPIDLTKLEPKNDIAVRFCFSGAIPIAGFTSIDNVGLIMCLTKVLFDGLPFPPIIGKSIFDWNKLAWFALFAAAVTSYGLSLFS